MTRTTEETARLHFLPLRPLPALPALAHPTRARVLALLLSLACTVPAGAQNAASTGALPAHAVPRPAETATTALHQRLLQSLAFADPTDFEEARRGFSATLPDGEIRGADGKVVCTLKGHAFIDAQVQPPASSNPSLWRQAKLNQIKGLFTVTYRV